MRANKYITVCAVAAIGLGFSGTAAAGAATPGPLTAVAPSGSGARADDGKQGANPLGPMIDKVRAEVAAKYPDMTQLQYVAGKAPSGPTRDASKLTEWQLVFNSNSGHRSVSVTVTSDGTVINMETHSSKWDGTVELKGVPKMSIADAYRILDKNGIHQAFQNTSLVETLVVDRHVRYQFWGASDGHAYAVYTDTGKVIQLY